MTRRVFIQGLETLLLATVIVMVISEYHALRNRRLIGGKPVKKSKNPFVVKMSMYSPQLGGIFGHLCTGVIITPNYTLTVAHCAEGIELIYLAQKAIKIVIRYLSDVNGTDDYWNYSFITGVKKHPTFRDMSYDKVLRVTNDIAVVRHNPIVLRQYAKLSARDYASTIGDRGEAFGFLVGPASEIYGKVKLPTDMRMKEVVIEKCRARGVLLRPSVCVAYHCSRPGGLCEGDSGAPLIHRTGVIALNSAAAAAQCKKNIIAKHAPVVYTVVSPFLDWLQKQIQYDLHD